jgi:hypothetical protein
MDTAVRVVTALGAILSIVGLGWVLTGAFDYFSGRKNGWNNFTSLNKNRLTRT